ncbi:LysR family glycine cleavage system transcriptional activator [Shimia isoporae]|uniref:LysR family glycine cleavage system transcriptional activator n=1 Tax=Shimia isoporae TaxID=647720 RepID=A0A4R1N887_9RHOB|nr:LysR family transcriptional regulator [Shimia isoporae]TCK99740.1 LysR family glycine cleavage system transcriptional activator [Shimia isoporae]
MRHHLPSLNALRVFEAAARHMNMSNAADELGISQSAVSQQVRRLEEWMGTDLFRREKSRLHLTQAGSDLGALLKRQLNELSETINVLSQTNVPDKLVLRVEPAFGAKWLRRRLQPLSVHLGGVHMEMRTDHLIPAKFPEEADALIHYGEAPDWANVTVFPLLELHGFPACSPSLVQKHGPLASAEDIASYHLLHGEDRTNWRDWLNAAGVVSASHLGGTLYDDFGLTIEAAVDGEGALIADPVLCERELANGMLVPLSSRKVFCARFFLAIKDTSMQRAVVRKMRDWLLAESDAMNR